MAPTFELTSVTIAAAQPHAVAHFYAALLGYTIAAEESGPDGVTWAQIRPADGARGPTVNVEYDQHHVRPQWPSTAGAQTATQHLDIYVDDLDAATERAQSLGATLAGDQPQPDVRVLFDPDGHPFCLFR